MDAAVKAAHTAFDGEWSWWTPHERRKLPLKVHDVVLDNFEELAMIETLDVGAPLARTRGLKEGRARYCSSSPPRRMRRRWLRLRAPCPGTS
ncbi:MULTISPECIES: aldehyde dehydrogenase family protein [unclassified Streptomyces]|uniref:aldehyde dehydrogenase family protein n=1 Tax=unclassified Streptomyces TaxID=2593676 RepID=UPI0036E09E53